MTFIENLNYEFQLILPINAWNDIEILFGFFLVIACIMQRAKLNIFSSSCKSLSKISVKIGQIALFIQMMLGIITCIDGYYNIIDNKSHVLLALFVLSSSVTKFSVYLNLFEIESKKIDDLT